MRTKPAKFFGILLLALAYVHQAAAYVYVLHSVDAQPFRWTAGSIVMHLRLGSQPTTQDTNINLAVYSAMQIWNANLSTVQFSPVFDSGAGGDGDNINQIFFADNVYGDTFDHSTLAITTGWTSGNQRVENDIVFNNTWSWDSYRGPVHNPVDIRRVALHELGHVLGLDHPDQAVPPQFQVAVMDANVSDVDTLQTDDLLGAQNLYGAAGAGAPANDNFASATNISLSNGTIQVTGSSIYPNLASRESGEPLAVVSAGGHTVWWKWTAPSAGPITVDTRGSLFDTTLGIYTGSAVSALTTIGTNDDEPGAPQHVTSAVSFTAVAGTTYYIAVDGFTNAGIGAESGAIMLNLTFAGGTAPTISNPSNASVTEPNGASFTVTAGGSPAPTVQWQRQPAGGGGFSNLSNNGTYSGVTTTTLTISSTTPSMNGDQFKCVATNSAGSATSAAATLTVAPAAPPVVYVQPTDQTVVAGATAGFYSTCTSYIPVSIQWQRKAYGAGAFSNLSNDGTYSAVTGNYLQVAGTTPVMNGDQFRCVFTNASGSATTNVVTLTVQYAPTFSGSLAGHSVAVGGSTSFVMPTLTGNPSPTVQWQRLPAGGSTWANLSNNATYSGVTTGTLGIANATPQMNGDQFRCTATNSVSTTNTNAASLTVTSPTPIITSDPVNREASPGGSPTFTIGVIGTPTPTLQWQRLPAGGGGWADLSNGGSYSGVTTTTLTVSSLTLGMNGDQFRCVATNGNGTATSAAATLTVGPLVTGDFNFDRQKDLVWENTVTGDRALWLMNGTVYIGGASLGNLSTQWRVAGAADFDGDGKTDILWENTVTGDRMFWLMDGTTHAGTVDMGIVSTAWRIAATADFNGDHKTDIMVENTSTGERVLWLMNGTVVNSTISYGTIPTAWRIAASADFNHDGQIDIVWENTSTGQHAIWLMNGTIFQSAIDFGSIPTQWRLATVGDFNADGDADFFWENTVTGDRALWLMHGTIFSTSIYFGIISTDWNIAP